MIMTQSVTLVINLNTSAKAHLREALLMHEEALRVNRMCPEMRKKDILQDVLKHFHERSLAMYEDTIVNLPSFTLNCAQTEMVGLKMLPHVA